MFSHYNFNMLTSSVKSIVGKKIMASAFVFCSAVLMSAEMFRVQKTSVIRFEDSFDKKSVVIGVNDAVAVRMPEDMTFVQGVEISVKVPQVVAEWYDSVAWSLYSDIKETPGEDVIDYSGKRFDVGTFGTSLGFNIRIPVSIRNSMKRDAYSNLVDLYPLNGGKFVFFRLQLAMKGASDDILLSEFEVTAKPVLRNEGILLVNAVSPEGKTVENYNVFLDGKQVSLSDGQILLKTGSYDFSLVTDFYRNELRHVSISQGCINRIDIKLKDIKPLVMIAAPEHTKIVFDGMEFVAPVDAFYTTQGDHTVVFKVGDYEVVKTLTCTNGRNYNISVNLDAFIKEE